MNTIPTLLMVVVDNLSDDGQTVIFGKHAAPDCRFDHIKECNNIS